MDARDANMQSSQGGERPLSKIEILRARKQASSLSSSGMTFVRAGESAVASNSAKRDSFLTDIPPGLEKDEQKKNAEDEIPDTMENRKVREFLKNVPKSGLFQPLGEEIKLMQCFRCKAFGHRATDKQCPMFTSGNPLNEAARFAHLPACSCAISRVSC
jgi:hypothetical protein